MNAKVDLINFSLNLGGYINRAARGESIKISLPDGSGVVVGPDPIVAPERPSNVFYLEGAHGEYAEATYNSANRHMTVHPGGLWRVEEMASCSESARVKRQRLLAQGKLVLVTRNGLDYYTLTGEWEDSSPSSARGCVLAVHGSGPQFWKNDQGVSLRSLR